MMAGSVSAGLSSLTITEIFRRQSIGEMLVRTVAFCPQVFDLPHPFLGRGKVGRFDT